MDGRATPQNKMTRAKFEQVNCIRAAIKISEWSEGGTGFLDDPVGSSPAQYKFVFWKRVHNG